MAFCFFAENILGIADDAGSLGLSFCPFSNFRNSSNHFLWDNSRAVNFLIGFLHDIPFDEQKSRGIFQILPIFEYYWVSSLSKLSNSLQLEPKSSLKAKTDTAALLIKKERTKSVPTEIDCIQKSISFHFPFFLMIVISLPSFLYFCHLPNITSAQKEEIDRGGKPGKKAEKANITSKRDICFFCTFSAQKEDQNS